MLIYADIELSVFINVGQMSDNKKWIKLIYTTLIHFTVGVTGFEPAASSSRTTRATKLRYTPIFSVANVQSFGKMANIPGHIMSRYFSSKY